MKMAVETIESIRPVAGKVGRPRQRPDLVQADKGYDFEIVRKQMRELGIEPVVERRGDPEMPLGFWRWVVERTNSWINQFRHLKVRYEVRPENYLAFLKLACAIIVVRGLA